MRGLLQAKCLSCNGYHVVIAVYTRLPPLRIASVTLGSFRQTLSAQMTLFSADIGSSGGAVSIGCSPPRDNNCPTKSVGTGRGYPDPVIGRVATPFEKIEGENLLTCDKLCCRPGPLKSTCPRGTKERRTGYGSTV